MKAILAIDQGTTSTRVLGFGADGSILSVAQKEHGQLYPKAGWVEHNPEEIWQNTLWALKKVYSALIQKGHVPMCIGITNQRETTVAWHKRSHKPLYNAVVWQDKRTADFCAALAKKHEKAIKAKAGLPLDPYFSASKMYWLLENVPTVKKAATENMLAFGTVDSFLLWRLTEGKEHATDSTNASRTLLFNIHKMAWSAELTALFGVPQEALPEVKPNTANFGLSAEGILPEQLPVTAMAGDQHAALFGQICFEKGMVKSTYGTGCFAMVNTGVEAVASKNGLLTTLGYHLSREFESTPTYALEGSIFTAGAGVGWLRDQLGLIKNAAETEELAKVADGNHPGLYLVPAFAGLGAPYWQSHAKGAIVGMTLKTDKAALAYAMLEAVTYQTEDLLKAMAEDLNSPLSEVFVDGGMVKNDWFCQRLSCMTQLKVQRPVVVETTAFGIALLAGLQAKIYAGLKDVRALWQGEGVFTPKISSQERLEKLQGWQNAVQTVLYNTKGQK